MPPPTGLPVAADPERHCLRRLRFGPPVTDDGRVAYRAEYEAEPDSGRQLFEVVVSAEVALDEHVRALIQDLRAAFEAVEPDPELLRSAETVDDSEIDPDLAESDDSGILIEMALVDPAEGEMVCGFTIDPSINAASPPHRYAPNDGDACWVRMCLTAGEATVRVFRGNEATRRANRQANAGCTSWLDARVQTPRARVNGHADGTSYAIYGGWHRTA